MPRKMMKEIKVQISFEPSRIQNAHLTRAFEIIVPLVRHLVQSNQIKESQQNNFVQIHKEI